MRWPWTTRAKFDQAMKAVTDATDMAKRALDLAYRLEAENAAFRRITYGNAVDAPDLVALAPASQWLQ